MVRPLDSSSVPAGGDDTIIKSIPGFCKDEVDVLQTRFLHLQTLTASTTPSIAAYDEEERKVLWNHRQEQQALQGKHFGQYSSLTSKRKAQVQQKKDMLNRIFGYNNTLNHEYITNNTSYSALDSVMNTSKSYQEDKEEMSQLLAEDKEYHASLEESKANLRLARSVHLYNGDDSFHLSILNKKLNVAGAGVNEFDHYKYLQMISNKLTGVYGKHGTMKHDAGGAHDDLTAFAMSYLRRCIRHEPDGHDHNDL
ncbi:hypothetical protein CANTEDRAFT_115294 [Yamadazyma tenuis ATCC 10573]|nr:uncharacterized protein CANTEDRAFT_115294 [Yamadazyma tenuis ATCC 10573]EGV62682.1 hypothetical protein CANTEDRAFT_115294 [Yamadazyma tenuis ATCC 10573]